MNVTFHLRFSTQPRQSLWLNGQSPLPDHPVALKYVDHECWQVTVPLTTEVTGCALNYSYQLLNADGSYCADWGQGRSLIPSDFNAAELLVLDSWNIAGYFENAFYTAPFKKFLPADPSGTLVKTASPAFPTHTFRVKSPLLEKGQTLCLLGECPVLGNWQTTAPALLRRPAGEDFFPSSWICGSINSPSPINTASSMLQTTASSALKTDAIACSRTI
jgi:4-alpha-glucanotransferase